METVPKTLPQCRWTDVSGIIRKLRMLKSVYEIEQIEKAAAILHTGLTQIKSVIREGMTELEIDGHLAMELALKSMSTPSFHRAVPLQARKGIRWEGE